MSALAKAVSRDVIGNTRSQKLALVCVTSPQASSRSFYSRSRLPEVSDRPAAAALALDSLGLASPSDLWAGCGESTSPVTGGGHF